MDSTNQKVLESLISSHTYQIQEDIILRKYVASDFLENAMGFQPAETDTVIVGYPRSGTTWVSYLLYLLKNEGEPIGFGERLWEDIPEIGVGRHVKTSFGQYFVQLADMASHPRIVKTHLPSDKAPIHPKSKVIYISRNPYDTAISLFSEVRNINEFSGSFEDFFTYFLHGQTDYNDYFDHHLGWHNRKASQVVLWLTYEELKMYPRAVIKKLGDYMGGAYARSANEDYVVNQILKYSSFTEMRAHENLLVQPNPNRINGYSFFNSGRVGEFKEKFTKEQMKRLSAKFSREFTGTPFVNTWKKYGLPATGINKY